MTGRAEIKAASEVWVYAPDGSLAYKVFASSTVSYSRTGLLLGVVQQHGQGRKHRCLMLDEHGTQYRFHPHRQSGPFGEWAWLVDMAKEAGLETADFLGASRP